MCDRQKEHTESWQDSEITIKIAEQMGGLYED